MCLYKVEFLTYLLALRGFVCVPGQRGFSSRGLLSRTFSRLL